MPIKNPPSKAKKAPAKPVQKKTAASAPKGAKAVKTRLTIKHDCGFHNHLTIRGSGANLSWHKGIPLKNVHADEWVFETDLPFARCEFKVLINDQIYESGMNRILVYGSNTHYTPHF